MDTKDVYWQCSKSLMECVRYMYTNEINCDVIFHVGENMQKIQAHKFILMSRSPVFYAMFAGLMAESDKIISIPDIQRDVFDIFLTYLYTDAGVVTEDNVLSLLYTANKYCVDGLAKLCTDLLMDKISFGNICDVLDIAELYHDEDLKNRVLEFVYKNSFHFLSSDEFLDLCPKCLEIITSMNELMVSETSLFESVMKWADKECGRLSLDINATNRRRVVCDVIRNIKFFMISTAYLEKNVFSGELLTKKEKEDILSHQTSKVRTLDHTRPKQTSNNKISHRECCQVMRFSDTDADECCYGGDQQAIEFQTSRDMCCHGIVVYGTDCYQSCCYDVTIELHDNENNTIHKEITSLETSVQTELYKIYFKRPIFVYSGKRYSVLLTMYDFETKSGVGGKHFLHSSGAEIRFYNSVKSCYSTDVDKGQIPACLRSRKPMKRS